MTKTTDIVKVTEALVDRPLAGDIVAPGEDACPVCADSRRVAVEEYYVAQNYHAANTAAKFRLPVSWIKHHVEHIDTRVVRSEMLESGRSLIGRIKHRGSTLWGFAITAAATGELDTAARLAETARRYDEMLLKLHKAPGFEAKTEAAKVSAPNSKIVIVQSEDTQRQ